ncbi:MAG: hypothetical protein V3U65_09125 [Granulosicoccaceae bacterium]
MSSIKTTLKAQAHWQAHVEACDRQGLGKAQYCRNNELTYHCFIYWHAKFSEQTIKKPTPKTDSSKLIPVALAQGAYPAELQIRLPNGVLISGISDQSVALIGQLIDQL